MNLIYILKVIPYRAVNTPRNVLNSSQLNFNTGIIADCSDVYTKKMNSLCGQNTEFLIVKPHDSYSHHTEP